MALAALPQATQNWLNANRPGPTVEPGSWFTALVSDLQVGDYLHGPRCKVTGVGATSGTPAVRSLTLERIATGVSMTVSWPAASTVWVRR
jgi:hypothetical protein